jgi:uncharacterized protein (TIGR02265 family)
MLARFVYEHTFEGLFVRGLAGRLSPKVKERLREAGLDLDRKLLPAYSVETWARCVAIVSEALYPGEPEEVAYRLLGERMTDGYHETFTGRAALQVLRLLVDPRRLIARTQQIFRSGNNYTEVRITEVAPTVMDLWVNEVGPARYIIQGAILAGLRAFRPGDEGVRVDVLGFTDEGLTLRVSWSE